MEHLGKQLECEEKNESEKQFERKKTKKSNVWKNFFGKKDNIILLILGGILLMIIAIPTKEKSENEVFSDNSCGLDDVNYDSIDKLYRSNQEGYSNNRVDNSQVIKSIDKYNGNVVGLELRLENLLMQMEGCHNAYVMTTFDSEDVSNNKQYDYCFYYPKIDGVVVVIQADNFDLLEEKITYVIQSLFSLDAHKIKVINMKTK